MIEMNAVAVGTELDAARDAIFKKYGNITVCIEIHTVLKNTWKQLKEYNNMDLTKAVMQDVLPLDSGYYVLSPVDRFVF